MIVFFIAFIFMAMFLLAYFLISLDQGGTLFLPGKFKRLQAMRKRYKLGIIVVIFYLLFLVHSEYTSTNIAGYIFTALLILFGVPIIITYFGICYALTLKGIRKIVCFSISLLLLPLLVAIIYYSM